MLEWFEHPWLIVDSTTQLLVTAVFWYRVAQVSGFCVDIHVMYIHII